MKILTSKTYIKHIKNVIDFDNFNYKSFPDTHPITVKAKKSEKLLKAHKLMDLDGCYIDNNHPAKKKALDWYYKHV